MGGPLSESFPQCEGKGGRRIRGQERSIDSGMGSTGGYERKVAESLLIGEEKRETNYRCTNNMGESLRHHAERRKPVTEECILIPFSYSSRQN